MTFYYFADISHHKGDLDIQGFADAGHRICIPKASDNYNLPNREGKYNWNPQNHIDNRFVQNYVNTRNVGLVSGAYHFCRWDRPLPLAGRDAIVEANLAYFRGAVGELPPDMQNVKTVIMDMEQSSEQLRAAGRTRTVVSNMARDMVTLFAEHYDNLILYAGSWWTDMWLNAETTTWMAQRMGVWEPEYKAILNNKPLNPNYKPSVPRGFSNEYAVSAKDFVGKLFAWQFTDRGNFFGKANIDTNQTMMPKDELFKLFHQDGSVDPPGPVEPPTGCEKILDELQELIDKWRKV